MLMHCSAHAHVHALTTDTAHAHAEGEYPYDIAAPAERNDTTPLQNEWLCKLAAEEIADFLHHSNSHASVDSSAKRWIRSEHVSDEFRKVLPDIYKKS